MDNTDFNAIARAILLYYEQRNSLFADLLISEELKEPAEVIRSKIKEWSHVSPEELVTYLEPRTIKRHILITAATMKSRQGLVPHILIEPMTEEEVNHDGEHLRIHYQFVRTAFGNVLIASTLKGICYLAFADNANKEAVEQLQKRFPKAKYEKENDDFQQQALSLFENKQENNHPVHLHLKGSLFQVNIWKKLLEIPFGGLMSYSALAHNIRDSHALGAAVGSNPVAYIIPCHRTVRASGEFGDYHWGRARKAALICLEAIQSK